MGGKPKALLINPPQKHYADSFSLNVSFPIGLMNLAASAREYCDLTILDAPACGRRSAGGKKSLLFGAPFESILDEISRRRPDIIGVSIPFSSQAETAVGLCRKIKNSYPDIPLVAGGAHVSVRYKHLLENEVSDYCIPGEGENSFARFVRAYADSGNMANTPGTASMTDGSPVLNPADFISNLDDLPLPAYDMVDVRSYLQNPYLYNNRGALAGPAMSITTSRGCPFSCSFCSVGSHMGKKHRYHSPGYVMRHLELLVSRYAINKFHFEDDNISLHRDRFRALMNEIIKSPMDIAWDLPNGIKADTLDPETLADMKKAGCRELRIAIESADQNTLTNIIRKQLDIDKAVEILKQARRTGLRASAFYVIGFPGETVEGMKKTVDLALRMDRQYNVLPILLVATPLYGTELYRVCSENGYIREPVTGEDLACGTHIMGKHLIETPDFSPRDIDRLAAGYALRYSLNHPDRALRKLLNRARKLFS